MDPHVELLWWEGCPSHPQALAQLRAVLGEEGLDPEAIDVREVPNDETAEREGFVGSPTIRIDGRDVDPAGASSPPSLSCRIYHLPDGRVSPVPSREQLEEAVT